MLKRFAMAAALLICAGLLPIQGVDATTHSLQATVVAQASPPQLFDTESAAQAHCPKDVVVCLNIPSGIYHYNGERWYGRTKHGAYVCEKETVKAGGRASENGQ